MVPSRLCLLSIQDVIIQNYCSNSNWQQNEVTTTSLYANSNLDVTYSFL